jgi:methylthioribose-1-phosphate isomerase
MKPLEWIDSKLKFLDQTKLSLEEFFCETDDVVFIAEAIKRFAIRGAPLIGIAACSLTTT